MKSRELEITEGRYTLHGDSQCFWITERTKTKSKTAKAEFNEKKIAGYSYTFEQLMDSFMDAKLRNSDAKDMEKALKQIESALRDAKKIVREYVAKKL